MILDGCCKGGMGMIGYAVILFLIAGILGVMAVLIYKGKTELIHDYHQTGVTDKEGYGRSFGKAMGIIAGAMALSGIVSLLGESTMWCAVAVLAIGLIVGPIAIVRVQKKYNGGIF